MGKPPEGITMKTAGPYRGVEDPISGIFNLAEEVSSRSETLLFYSHFALIFTLFALFFVFILIFAVKNIFFRMVLVAIFIMGIISLLLISSLRGFLKDFAYRYSAIKAMREGPPAVAVPTGKNMTDRFLAYLKENNRAFRRLLKKTPEVLRKDAYIKGGSGKRYHYDAFILLKPPLLSRLLKRGEGYALFIKELKHIPRGEDIERILNELDDIYRAHGVLPARVSIIFRAPPSYRGIPEDLYRTLVDEGVYLPGRRGKRLNFQVVAELEDGTYEFIPVIPDLPNILP